jgi:hypothetical protein
MKTKLLGIMAIANLSRAALRAMVPLLIITLALIGCSGDDKPTTTEHVHQWGEWTVITPATCTTAGEETRTCKLDANHTETQVIAALGHDWGEWVITTPPTTTAEGVETRTCKRDSAHKETRTIPKDEPKDQTATINLSFKKPDATEDDPFLTATVQGYLTNVEWNGVADKIETTINDGFGTLTTGGILQDRWRTTYSRSVTIIVEASPDGYTNWKATGDGKTLYLSLDAVNGENLTSLFSTANNVLYNNNLSEA